MAEDGFELSLEMYRPLVVLILQATSHPTPNTYTTNGCDFFLSFILISSM